VRSFQVVDLLERVPQVVGHGSAAAMVWSPTRMWWCGSGGPFDELLDRPPGDFFDPPADGEGGEHDGQVGVDRVAFVAVDRPGLEVSRW
jgi:hypothetical protein